MDPDYRALRRYVEHNDQTAFAQIVNKNMRLVYGACLRELEDSHLAEDATQVTFVVLARKCRSIHRGTCLTAWLFTTARNVAKTVRRSEARRARHDATVVQQANSASNREQDNELTAYLNQGLAMLSGPELTAISLRFFQELSLADIGLQLGISEDAARKRVGRAVDKLGRSCRRANAVLSTPFLTAYLTEQSRSAVPACMSQNIMSAVSNPGHHLVNPLLQLYEGTLKLMKLKLIASTCVVGVGLAVISVVAVQASHFSRVLKQTSSSARPAAPTQEATDSSLQKISASAASQIAGTWRGLLTVGSGTPLHIVFSFDQDSRGYLTGYMISPDQSPGAALDQSHLVDGVLDIKVPANAGAYHGNLAKDGQSINGTWSQHGVTWTLNLTKSPNSTTDQTPRKISSSDVARIAGTWRGLMSVGNGTSLHIVFTFDRNARGYLTGYMISPDQSPLIGPGQPSFVDGIVDVQVPANGGSYRGSLTKDGRIIHGVWSQHGVPLQLDLSKAP